MAYRANSQTVADESVDAVTANRWRTAAEGLLHSAIIRLVLLSTGATLVITALVCLIPVRWDIKSFAPSVPQFDSSGVPANSQILFVSEDNDWENGHYALFGLDLLTFPAGKWHWVVFKEGERPTSWPPRWTIDRAGKFYAIGEDSAWHIADGVPPDLNLSSSTAVVVPTADVKAQLLERWPSLGSDQVLVMKRTAASFWEFPRLRITISQAVRLFVLVFIVMVAFSFLCFITGEDGVRYRLLNLGLAIPAVLVINTVVVYVLGRITAQAIVWTFALELIAAIGLIFYMYAKGVLRQARLTDWARPAGSQSTGKARLIGSRVLVVAGVLIYLSFSAFRLDFDSDVLTQYLPVARYHYLAGSHQPEVLLDRYGLMTQATYPPAFSVLISTFMWIGDLPKGSPLAFSDQTNLAVFLYRLGMSVLHLSFLLSVSGLFVAFQKEERRWGWLLALGVIALTVPLFLGRPDASEIYLVPLVGFSMLALFAGDTLKQAIYTNLGLFFGSFGLFLKKEGLLILLLIVLPWYLVGRLRSSKPSLRQIATNSLSLFLGLIPFLMWKIDINSLHIPEYFFYDKFSPAKLMSSLTLVKVIVEKATKILLGNGYWVVLFLVFPLATIYGLLRRRSWRQAFIPIGILTYIGGMTLVYVFSRHPGGPALHMDISYERILAIGVVSAILYSSRVVFCGAEELSS
jgi:hypothetical protein